MAKTGFGVIGQALTRTYKAAGAIGAGIAVMADAADATQVKLPTGQNVRALGVAALPSVNAGDPLPVVEFGEVIAIADAAITRGQWVMVNAATGQLAPVGAVAGTNYETVGIALEAAVAQGDEFLLLVVPQRVQG